MDTAHPFPSLLAGNGAAKTKGGAENRGGVHRARAAVDQVTRDPREATEHLLEGPRATGTAPQRALGGTVGNKV